MINNSVLRLENLETIVITIDHNFQLDNLVIVPRVYIS